MEVNGEGDAGERKALRKKRSNYMGLGRRQQTPIYRTRERGHLTTTYCYAHLVPLLYPSGQGARLLARWEAQSPSTQANGGSPS